ncbi:uncharacterized protein [Antedon mediterranea]|uniref:uncharacterized protein n=1 Tax=Antedon mediterranea TaxID=105859 RepID=UPI003AF72F1F
MFSKKTTVKKNLRKSKSKCTDSLEIFIDANEDVDDSQIQEPRKSNTNISTSFRAPTSKSIKSIKNNEKQDGLLVALRVASLRPSSQVNNNQVDPYEFIPSQRTPRKKPKRKEKKKATKQSITITKQRNESRKAGMMMVVDDIDVHTNDENELEHWNDTELNLNMANEVKNQLDSRTSNQVCKKTAETVCTESKIQEGDANIVYIKDPKPITDQITDNEGDIHKCNGNDNHSIVTDVLIDGNDQCGNKEKDISDVLDDDSEDWQRTKSVAVNENKSVFRKVYTIKRRKSNSPENKKSESSAMSNSEDEDDVAVGKNDIVTRRKKMQESLKKFGKSEESILKHTRRSVKKLDKTDWEIALELAQEFGTLPKELTSKRHSLRKLKPEVNIQGVAKCSSTEKSKPRKSRGRKTLLSEDSLASDEQQIQEYSDSYAERKTFPPTSNHVSKRDSELKASLITEAGKTITRGTNCEATEASPQVQTQPKVVPETPVIANEKSSKLARDTHPEVENPNIHTTTEVKRRSKRQSLVNSPRQNNCINSDRKNNKSGRRSSRSKRSNSDLNYSQSMENLSDQSSNLGNDKCSTNANCPVAEDKIQHCSLSEKRSQMKVVDTLESGTSDNELSTSCIQDLNNESSKHILAVKEANLETMQEDKKIVDRCQDETGAQGDTTDSIELSVSDIEYEEPSIKAAKDFENVDESCVENIPQKETSYEVCHQTTNHIAAIVSDAECLKIDQDSSNLPEAVLVSQSLEDSKKKVKRSLRSVKRQCGNLSANKENAKKEQTKKLEQTTIKNGSDTNEQLQDGVRQEVLDINKIPLEISEDGVKTIPNSRKNNCKKSPASNNILTRQKLPAEKNTQDRVLPCPDYSQNKTPISMNPEPQKKTRRSKRKTFALGNTPEKIEDASTSMNTSINLKDPISDNLRHSDIGFDSEKSMYKSASELFDSRSPLEVEHLDLNEASKECSNLASKKTTETIQSQDCIIPSSIDLKTNSDVFSGSDELSSISTKRKSRKSRGSQSSRRSQRLSGHSSSFSLNEQSKTILNERDFKQVVKDAVCNEVMMSNSDQLSPVKMTQISTESFLGSNISSKIDSSNNKMSGTRNKKSRKETVETTQPGTDEVIPGSKGESQTSSNITPPIIDYRPVMKKKRLALKSRTVAEKTHNDNCGIKTIDIDHNKKAQEEIKETSTQLKEAKERNPPNNSTPKHFENSDTKTMHSDTKNNDNDNSEFQMDKEVNDDLGSFKETARFQEVEKIVSDCSSDGEDDDSVIPPTPNQNHSVANTTKVTKFSKNIFPVKKIAVETVEGNNKNLRIESSLKEDYSLTGGNCTSQESESNSLSVFQVIDQQKVQLISPLEKEKVSAKKNVQRKSQVTRVKDSQEFSEKRNHDMLVEEIDKNMKVDEYQEDILTPELLESDVPTQSSHLSETLVEGYLYSDNENCSEDECFPLQNANSVSSLLSSQAEILNTQQRETAKEEMERIAKQIKEMETEMAEKKLAEDTGIEDVTEITLIDEDFNPEGLSDSDCEIVETGVSAGGVKQVEYKKVSQKKQKLAKGRSRILRPTVDSDTDDEDIERLEIETKKEKESVFINLDADIIEDDNLISGCKATPQSSNSCLKSLSQSLFHSPRSPSPPPPISAELLLEKSPLELQEKLSSSHSIVQEYKGSQRKRKVIGDAFSQPQTTPKRPRAMETDNPVTAPSDNAGSIIEHTPVKMKKNYSFVATGLTRAELKQVEQLANKCGFPFASKFNNNTTHVIVKTDLNLVCERTLKYFLGIAGKKWIVSYKWILDSLDMGFLLPEDEYEVIGDVASGTNHMGPKRSRMQKTSLLEGYDICCIGEFTMLTKEQLAQLLELTGVTKVSHPTMFSFNPDCKALIIAQSDVDQEPINFKSLFRKFRVPVISREWILDSIAPSAIQPLDDYLLCDVPQNILEKY